MTELFILPGEATAWPAVAMIALSMATSFITAAFGIGGGVILLAVLAVMLPPAVLIPVHGAVQLGSNGGRTLMMLAHVRRAAFLPFTLGSLAGAAAGGLLFVQVPGWAIQFAIAGFILWSVFGGLPALGYRHVAAAGFVSSFLTMFFGATGSFVATIVKGMRLDPVDHVATHSALMTIQHLVKTVVFGLLGFAFGAYLPLVLAMIASGLAGTFLGKQVLVRLGRAYFLPVLNTVLVLLALQLVWTGLRSVTGW